MKTLKPELIPVKELRPHEKIIEDYFKMLLEDIINDKSINNPIIVDKKTKVILDGHHRFSVAKKLKLSKIPVLLIDYLDDSIISVFSRRENVVINKDLVIKAGKTGKLFPNKSTRHVLHVPYYVVSYDLSQLSK